MVLVDATDTFWWMLIARIGLGRVYSFLWCRTSR
jgi:hypothetical protein